MSLDHYRLLGRSGLRISPMALGTMTFGADWGWGADEAEARRIFDSYVDRGGNFVDTANNYTNGSAETLLGRFVQGQRDRLVIASKYTRATVPGDPNNAGNPRKSMLRSVEDSLRRLGTDYLDLLYLHAWDDTTGVDEVMRGFDDLVRSGKVLYAGISDTPAWQIARMQTLADLRGWSPLVALQIEYSLIQRSVEHELLPMADALGLGVVAWSPLGSGVLTGKYSTADLASADALQATPGGSRRSVALINGALTSRSLQIADEVQKIAADLSHFPAQVALAWLLRRPGADALPIIGARTLEQFEHNLIALDLELPTEALTRLDAISAVAPAFPHDFLQMPLPRMLMSGGTRLRPRAR